MRDDARHELGIDEPEARRHRRAVVEERRVADHDRLAGRVAHDDLERAARLPAEQHRERRDVGLGGRHAGRVYEVVRLWSVVVVVVAESDETTL